MNTQTEFWLIANQVQLFVLGELSLPKNRFAKTSDITIVGKSKSDCLNLLGKELKVLAQEDQLKEIYSFKTGEIQINGCILEINLNHKEMELISESSGGNFYYYGDFLQTILNYKQEDSFKESLFTLISYLDNEVNVT